MELECSARDYSTRLSSSSRIGDRKKCAEALKDLLSRNALPSLLTKNSLNKKGFSWNDLFDDINEFILKETEKFESSKAFFTTTAPLCTSLLHMCVAGANRGQAYLKCDKILDACLFILKKSRLTKAVGDAYLNLLYKYVLPCDYYLGYITPMHWEDLLHVCISVCLLNDSSLDNYTKLRLVSLIIKNGTKYCQTIIPLRDSIPKLKKCFLHVQNEKKVQEVIIEIITLVVEKMSTESRLLMCEFTENVLSLVLKFYDNNLEQKKKNSLFKLLEMVVSLHHPAGKLQREVGSLAYNWETWNKHKNNVLDIITLEVVALQKVRIPGDNCETHNSHFCSLAAAMYHQNFNSLEDNDESEAGTSIKRQKVALNRNKTLSDLIYQLQLNHTPWLGILHIYIKYYGGTISALDYLSIIKIIENILNGNYHHFEWCLLEDITCLIIENLILSKTSQSTELDEAVLSLWNSCVRNSTSVNESHKHVHSIMQALLKSKMLKYQSVQPLIKLYIEKGMPVNNSTVETLNRIIYNFFNKCSSLEKRKCFLYWFVDGDIVAAGEASKELLLRITANDNINFVEEVNEPDGNDLFDILFCSIEKSILFSEFELDLVTTTDVSNKSVPEISEVNIEMNNVLQTTLQNILCQLTEKHKNDKLELLQYSQSIKIILTYLDVMIKFQLLSKNEVIQMQLYNVLKSSLNLMFVSFVKILKNDTSIPLKIQLLQYLKELLLDKYVPLLSYETRQLIKDDFFHCANNILYFEKELDGDVIYDGDDNEMNFTTLKYNCIYTLAAYCRVRGNYREEILELILDPKLYNFTSVWDVKCALQCLEILIQCGVEEPPIESIFVFMQHLCKDLFRIPEASFRLLSVLYKMLELLWSQDEDMKLNTFIMIRGFLERCEKLFYPPPLAALILKCAAKIISLNSGQITDADDIFMRSLIKRSKGTNHCIRIYCCYLLEKLTTCSCFDISTFPSDILDIFDSVPEREQVILKDESLNRTLTVLHSLVVTANAKKKLLRYLVTFTLSLHIEKLLDKRIVKKVLNIITTKLDGKTIDEYLNKHILSILQFWFYKKYDLNNLPLDFFNVVSQSVFFEKHMPWLISADILWRSNGNMQASSILNRTKAEYNKSENDIIEACFCNIIVLCLPFIVTEKYKIPYKSAENDVRFNSLMINAKKMFQMTRNVLETDKWSNLFAENIGEILLLTTTHLSDHNLAKEEFRVDVPDKPEVYQYPKIVFHSILAYLGELTDGDIMLYLCEDQPVVIFKILLNLWENVLQENILELKVLCIHAFKTFVECVPLVPSTEAFACNYVCKCFGYAIKKSRDKKEVKVLTQALKTILIRFLPAKAKILKKALSQLMSILIIKMEEGFEKECKDLLQYLVEDMKDYLKEQEDVVDFIRSMSSQRPTENLVCSTLNEFSDRLETYKLALTSPSFESLSNLHQFLKINKEHVCALCKNLVTIRFSEDCGNSIIHQMIYELTNILKSQFDDKTIIEACNCLSEIGTYGLKTLVTLPPSDTRRIVSMEPRQTLASTVVTSLAEVVFDENPQVTSKVTKTLHRLLKYREGVEAIDLNEVEKQILKPFVSEESNAVATFVINDAKFSNIADLQFMVPNFNETHGQWIVKKTEAIMEVLVSKSNYLNALRDVCRLKVDVCQKILPVVIGMLIYISSENHVRIISQQINNFFKHFWEITFGDNIDEGSEENSGGNKTNILDQNQKIIVQNMLDVVNFVRLQRNRYKFRSKLNLDYVKISWVATVADQNLSAIYYGELWATDMNDGVPPSSPDATTALIGGRDLQTILRKSFVSIGELDAVDGCGTAHLTSEDEKLKHLTNTGQYSDALFLHDIALSSGKEAPSLYRGVVRSLHKSGMHHLALQYIKSLPESEQLNDIKYECLSFLGDWSDFVDTRDLEEKHAIPNINTESVLKAFRYACLKDCLNIQMKPEFQDKLVQPLNRAKLAVAKLCQQLNMENCQNVYKVLSKLHLFTDIEDYFSVRCDKLSLFDLLNKWRVENLPAFQDFKHLEDLISQRNIILEHTVKSDVKALKDIVPLQLRYVEFCLENRRIQMAQRLLAAVKRMQTSEEVTLLESQISWAKGHKDIALSLLRNVVSNTGDQSNDERLAAVSLRQYGLWMAESKSDNARDIINKYLKKSLELTRGEDLKTRQKIYFDIAKFADAEYKQVVTYMNSSIFENKVKCLENIKETASTLKLTQTSTMTKDERKSLFTNQRFEQLEEAEIASTRAEKQTFLHLAMRYYLLSLQESEDNDLSVFRVISLWLDNPNLQLDPTEHGSFKDLLHRISSHKFITVLPQLAPRLSDEESAFADNLKHILSMI
ncbi:unnamed protein product [Diatraea saccharalis]|uniref:FAT domain-containing protein n=1 Tax=Diatraea saccharalis TaxID=40085 RepID=A0A9P0C468_9NEOP|nr:unnamed protein product [Diatraea saccharalis]